MCMNIIKTIKLNKTSFVFNTFMPLLLAFTLTLIIGDFSIFYNSLNHQTYISPVVFMIVWSILYILLGFSSFLFIENVNSPINKNYYYIHWINIFINFLWVIMFFGFNDLFSPIFILISLIIFSSIL